jgi:hypothetical protein
MAPQLKQDLEKRGLPPDSAKDYGDVKVAARILGVSESFLNKARTDGSGPAYEKFGAAVRYHIPTLREWAAARTRHSTSEAA